MGDGFRVDRIDHVELWVPDQDEAAAWYEKVLGLEVVPELEEWAEGGPLMIATAEGPTMLALFQGQPGRRRGHTPDFRRVAFRVAGEAFSRFLERLEALDLEAEDGERLDSEDVVDHGQSLSIYFRDPWGHRFEVTTYEPEVVRAARES